MKITVTTNAYIPDHSQEAFAEALREGDEDGIVGELAFSRLDLSAMWAPMGKATITVDIPDEHSIKMSIAKSLEAKRDNILAEAQAQAVQINAQIQSLLAIEYVPEGRVLAEDELAEDDGGPL